MSVWRVEVREPAGEGDWELWGRHPSEAEAQLQASDYLAAHPQGEARVYDEAVGPSATGPAPSEGLIKPLVKTVVSTVKKIV